MATTPTKRSRIWAPADAINRLSAFLKNNNLTVGQAGAELGLSGSGLHEYFKTGRVPHTVDLAVRYLDEKAKDPDGVKHYLLTLNGDTTAIKNLGEFEEMTMGNIRYKLIPL